MRMPGGLLVALAARVRRSRRFTRCASLGVRMASEVCGCCTGAREEGVGWRSCRWGR